MATAPDIYQQLFCAFEGKSVEIVLKWQTDEAQRVVQGTVKFTNHDSVEILVGEPDQKITVPYGLIDSVSLGIWSPGIVQ